VRVSFETSTIKIVDVSNETLTIEISGPSDKIEALEDMVRPFGIRETVRTGTIAIERGTRIFDIDKV